MMTDTLTPEEILARAADLLETRGWCQGTMRAPSGQLCVMGSIREASRFMSLFLAQRQATDALSREIQDSEPTNWNDQPDRTVEEVISSLRNSKRWL